jgi:hypothetical protein
MQSRQIQADAHPLGLFWLERDAREADESADRRIGTRACEVASCSVAWMTLSLHEST